VEATENPLPVLRIPSRLTLRSRKGGVLKAVHRLVLEAFVGPCPEGMECRHLDGNRTNNRLDNLAWGTRIENHEDMKRHGTRPTGSRHHKAKINESDIPEIIRMRSAEITLQSIAERFGITRQNVCLIVNGKAWRSADR
jgi:HNH endonuclease